MTSTQKESVRREAWDSAPLPPVGFGRRRRCIGLCRNPRCSWGCFVNCPRTASQYTISRSLPRPRAHSSCCATCASAFAPYLGCAAVNALNSVEGHGSTPLVFDVLVRSEEHTSELQSLMRISYAVFCLQKKNI